MQIEEWLRRMLSAFARQMKYTGGSAIWVLSRERWEIAQRSVETFINRLVVVRSGLQPNCSWPLGNLEFLAKAAERGDCVLVLIDDPNCQDFLNLLIQLVGYGGRIRHNQSVFAFGIDTFTIHRDFYFFIFVDPVDYRESLESRLPKNRLGPVFYLTE